MTAIKRFFLQDLIAVQRLLVLALGFGGIICLAGLTLGGAGRDALEDMQFSAVGALDSNAAIFAYYLLSNIAVLGLFALSILLVYRKTEKEVIISFATFSLLYGWAVFVSVWQVDFFLFGWIREWESAISFGTFILSTKLLALGFLLKTIKMFPQPLSEEQLLSFVKSTKRSSQLKRRFGRAFRRFRAVEFRLVRRCKLPDLFLKSSSEIAIKRFGWIVGWPTLMVVAASSNWSDAISSFDLDPEGVISEIARLAGFVLVSISVWLAISCVRLMLAKLRFDFQTSNESDRKRISTIVFGLNFLILAPVFAWAIIQFLSETLGRLLPASEGWTVSFFMIVMVASAITFVPVLYYLVFGLICIFAILSRGAFDPQLAIRKTTVYGIIGAVLTAVFVAIEGVVTSKLVLLMPLPAGTGAILGGVAVALMLAPLRNKVESGIAGFVNYIIPASSLAESTRHDAAVMFCDLKGYTRISERDEPAAMIILSVFHRELQRAAGEHSGRMIKKIGDAVLMEFRTCLDAIGAYQVAMVRFVNGCRALNVPLLETDAGLHFGPVVRALDGDIYGATVNLASRLEGRAEAFQVLMSPICAEQVAGSGFIMADAGIHRFKNVSEPVHCFACNLSIS